MNEKKSQINAILKYYLSALIIWRQRRRHFEKDMVGGT